MSESKAMILGAAGKALTAEERSFFRDERPWGFILFARNIGEPEAVRDLCASLREAAGNAQAAIFIDQEGGRVQRLRAPLAPDYPSGETLGRIHQADPDLGTRAAWLMSRLHAVDLRRLGIDADCLPVLDIPVEGASSVIGDRAYGRDVEIVSAMGRAAIDGLLAGGVLPVMKHIPGHGRANVDSHHELPRVDTAREILESVDFEPFRRLRDCPMAMTAHVVYTAIDDERPATTSARVIAEVIRGSIGFDSLLMSDDVSMQALSGDFATRTDAILAAGCDVVLHCNGKLEEARAVAERTPALAGKALERAAAALSLRDRHAPAEEATLRADFAACLAGLA